MIRFLHLSIQLVGIALLTLAQPRDTSAEAPSGAYVIAVNNPLAYFAEPHSPVGPANLDH